MDVQELINDNDFLRDENKRLTNEADYYFGLTAKADMFDILFAKGLIQRMIVENLHELDPMEAKELRSLWRK